MCGIAGIAGDNSEVIERMTRCLVHRGPDGNAVWTGRNASLGHARLAILDPRSEGDQPMWNDAKTIAIVFNGEIFNYRELREQENLQCSTSTDTEVILKLFEKHGIDFIHRLRGMFAFGIYDAQKDTWTLARDGKGIKPLYVAYPHGKLAFASEMRALMQAMPNKPALDMTSLSLYLRLQYVPGPRTMCEGIEQLPPGTILEWTRGKETRTSFTSIEHAHYASKNDFRERFPTLMDSVVKQHLISDKPVGLFLSGGMDSSIILHHMSAHAAMPIKTFTVRFEATDEEGAARFNTDAELAKTTAQHYGTEHHEVCLTAELFRSLYRDTSKALDQPNANAIAVAQFLLSKEAKKDVDVALSGIGGDELFGGYPRYRIARILRAAAMIPSGMRGAIAGFLGQPSDILRMSPGAELAERLLARPQDEAANVTRGDWYESSALSNLFETLFAEYSHDGPVRNFMKFDRRLWLTDEALRLADGTSMGNGLEGRVPFVDERIMAAADAVPESWHVTLGQTKTLLKETYRPLLPAHLFTLKKASFFSPVAKWLRRESASLADDMLEHARIREFFDTDNVRTLLKAHQSKDGYHLHMLLTLIQLQHWFDSVYDA